MSVMAHAADLQQLHDSHPYVLCIGIYAIMIYIIVLHVYCSQLFCTLHQADFFMRVTGNFATHL